MQPDRGKIHSPKRAGQLRDFSGLIFGNITPTDIDGLIEYKNCGYVILEFKLAGTEILRGQELALERLTDDLWKTHKHAICIIATHNTDASEQIDTANTEVTRYRFHGIWHKKEGTITKDLVTNFLNYCDGRL